MGQPEYFKIKCSIASIVLPFLFFIFYLLIFTGASVGSDVVLISVPIAVFCFILIVVIVVVVIVIRVRKRSNGYTFHPVSLDNIKDEDDEVLL